MPIYEYRCNMCHSRVTILTRSFASAESVSPQCPHCGSKNLTRLISRVAVVHSEEARLESLTDPAMLSGLDENDPRSIGRWMRRMSQQMGEDLGDEFTEIADRLESGQTPEEIESSLPDVDNLPEGL